MSVTTLDSAGLPRNSSAASAQAAADPAIEHAFRALHLGFVVAPVLAGADKFFNGMVDWTTYVARPVDAIVPGTAQQFLYAVGVIEISVMGIRSRAVSNGIDA